MKARSYSLSTALLIAVMLFAGSGIASEKSRLRVTFRGKKITMDSEVAAVVQKRSTGWRITIGAKKGDTMLNISGALKGELKEEGVSLDTEWHQLSIMFIRNKKVYNASPSLRMLRHGRVRYAKRAGGPRHRADWRRMSRKERLSRGRGMVRNRAAEGSRCTVTIVPVMEGTELVALKGHFEALMVNPDKRRRRPKASQMRGSFYAEVVR